MTALRQLLHRPANRIHPVRGGVHPDDRKALAASAPITELALPARLDLPLQQHIGASAAPLVRKGQRVAKGEPIARAQGAISAPLHAPTSGRVIAIAERPAHHPSGLAMPTISIEPDGEERWHPAITPCDDPFALDPAHIAERVAAAGIVGLGGATFPAAVKLNLGASHPLHTLVINGAECEPYLTCDDRLMRERAEAVIDGARIMAHALGVGGILVAIEDNKPEAAAAIETAAAGFDAITLIRVPTRYPMGSERHLVQALTGRETPARALTAQLGVVVHNPATAFAVHQALRLGQPLIARVVTLSGAAIARPANLWVPLGTAVETLIAHCGGLTEEDARLVSGGPMMGQPLPGTQVPTTKGCNGILALGAAERAPGRTMPCTRCGRCVEVCPCGLVPLELGAHIRVGDLDGAAARGLHDCLGCGSCAYTCPSQQPLAQYIAHAKGELAARERAKRKQAETKALAEQRTARLEAIKRAKREAMARRKREAARKQAEQQAAQAEQTETEH
ncbi:electron transport complex subunit RsxC [Marichromatium gracile]|uniref:Ion-translocating oxidoreductase complex subunit C n=1 Tax=Marichromatium gracile TaxID=1048 RepID=A0ABR5VLB5_MARGR|nr:electron transport complex subunit RsxC [Marichromatium gracile]KXX66280.1 electron transporter RnfC [Marichromatium gracile]